MRARSFMPAAFAGVYAGLPLFPAFIALGSVAFPGVSMVPAPAVLAVLGLVCAIAVYAAVVLVRYRGETPQPLGLPMLAWFAAAMLAALAGLDPPAGLLFVCIFGLSMVWGLALVAFFNDRHVAGAIFWSYAVSGGLAALAAIAMLVTRHPADLYTIGHGRAIGTFVLPGELAAYLVVFLPFAYALTSIGRSAALRAVAWIALALGLIALAATFSRAGWMGFAAAAAFTIVARARGHRRAGIAALATIAAGIVAVAFFFNARHNPSEDYTRLAIWQAATQVIDRFPLTGVGPFDFSRIYPLVRVPDGEVAAFHAHSLYLTFFAELGVLGLAAFLWNVWALIAALRRRLPHASPEGATLALAAAAGLVGVAVQGLIDTMSIVIFGLWMPTMGLAVAAAAWRAPERQ